MNTMNSYIKKEVALIGANTKFGRITSFLLKQSPFLSKLTLYDDKNLTNLNDIRYINTPCKVSFLDGRENMSKAIEKADIIIIADDNAKEVGHEATLMSKAPSFSDYIQQIATHNPNAIVVVATNPVNMTLPLAAEVLRMLGKLDERKLIGLTTENIKARCILAQHLQICPGTIDFPVIGGSTPETSVPILSKMVPHIPLTKGKLQKITCTVKTSANKLHNEGIQENLNGAYGIVKLVKSIVTALNGQPTIETVLSYQKIIDNTDYFSLPVLLGENGIMEHMTLSSISQHEKYLLSHAVTCMAADAKKAKNCLNKLKNNIMKPVSVTPNKLNKLKPPIIQNKQFQYLFGLSEMKNTFQPMSIVSQTNVKCNTSFKQAYQKENNAISKKVSDNALPKIVDSVKVLNKAEEQVEITRSEVNSINASENTDETRNITVTKFKHFEPEFPNLPLSDYHDARKTLPTCLNSDEPLLLESIKKKENASIGSGDVNNHSDAMSSFISKNKELSLEIEKIINGENVELKTQGSTTTNINNVNNERKKSSSDPTINVIKTNQGTYAIPFQSNNEVTKSGLEEDKVSAKYNNTINTGENITNKENIFFNKQTNNLNKPISVIQNKQPQYPSKTKVKSNSDCSVSTINSLKENILHQNIDNKLSDLNEKQTLHSKQQNALSKEVICTTLPMIIDSGRVLPNGEEQSEPRRREVKSIIDSKNIDDPNKVNLTKFMNFQLKKTKSNVHDYNDGSTTLGLKYEEPLEPILKKKEYSAIILSSINNHSEAMSSLIPQNKELGLDIEKIIAEENTELKSQILATKNIKIEKKIPFSDPIMNFANTSQNTFNVLLPPDNEVEKTVLEKDKLLVKCNIIKHYTTAENTSSGHNSLVSENLSNIFTSNIIKMVERNPDKKKSIHEINDISDAIMNQSEDMVYKRDKIFTLDSKCDAKSVNHIYKDLFKIKTPENKEQPYYGGESRHNPNSILSSCTKTSGRKCLQNKKPHWIVHNILFESEKYQSTKPPIWSRNISSESHECKVINNKFIDANSEKKITTMTSYQNSHTKIKDSQELMCSNTKSTSNMENKEFGDNSFEMKMKQTTSFPKSKTNIKNPSGSLQSLSSVSEFHNKETENNKFPYFNSEKKIKPTMSSLMKSQTNVINPSESIRSQYFSPESHKNIKNKDFVEFNTEKKLKPTNTIPKSDTTNASYEITQSQYVSHSNNHNKKKKEFVDFNSDDNKEQVISQQNNHTNIKIPHESTPKYESKKCQLTVKKFESVQNYNMQHQKPILDPNKSKDAFVFENVLKKQKDNISSGHKIASFKTEKSDDLYSVWQRKSKDFETVKKKVYYRNLNDIQKLHISTTNCKRHATNEISDKVSENELNSSRIHNSHCEQNYSKKNEDDSLKTISNQKMLTAVKTIENPHYQCTRGDKKNNLDLKDGEHDCKAIINHESKKYAGTNDKFNKFNNQTLTKPYKCMQKEAMTDHNEASYEVIMTGSDNLTKSHKNASCQVSPNINLKYIQQRPTLDSKTHSFNTEEVKIKENTQEHKSSKEIENDVLYSNFFR